MSEWQPIETMPIGKECLIVSDDRKRVEIRYRPKDRQDMLYPGGCSLDWYTHWMPLPSPPKEPEPTPDALPSKSEH